MFTPLTKTKSTTSPAKYQISTYFFYLKFSSVDRKEARLYYRELIKLLAVVRKKSTIPSAVML